MSRSGRGRLVPMVSLGVVGLALAASAIRPHDYFTWFIETVWVMIGVGVVLLYWRRFPLSTLLCCLLAFNAVGVAAGGHWTYAEVPLGEWVAELFDWGRNPYDRIGHYAHGFVLAVLVREVLARLSPLRRGRWLAPLTIAVCLAAAAAWELLEGLGALIYGVAADDFLGTQGDPWDAQWDMFLALCGAVTALLVLSRYHDRQLEQLTAGVLRL